MNIISAIDSLRPNSGYSLKTDKYEDIEWHDKNSSCPTREEIQNKLAELQSAEPMRLLRIERNQLLAQTDWRMTTDYPYSDQAEWASYRTALRNLPATTEPTLDENGNLVVDWPTPPDAT